MKVFLQDEYAEPASLAETADQSLVVHRRAAGAGTRLVIFVHGLGGTRYGENSTWGAFPKFLFEDIADLDVGMYQYETLWRRFKFGAKVPLDREAEIFEGVIRDDLSGYRDIVLVGHSMGGLLCKAVVMRLIQHRRMDLLDRIAGLFLLASPQLGSLRVPWFARWFSPDADALRPHGKLQEDIESAFRDSLLLDLDAISYDKPILPTFALMGASDFWVDQLSAGVGLPTRQKKVVVGTHTEVVKPRSKESSNYRWVLKKIEKCLERFEYDVFLAMAMASLETEEQYRAYRDQAMKIEEWLRRSCGFQSIFYAGRDLPTKEAFEAEDFSLSEDLGALRRSKYFMLVYPEKIASSVVFEAGLAIALGKPSVYFIRDRDDLPFLMRKAEQAALPAGVRVYEYANLSKIEALLQNPGEGLWKYSEASED